MNRYELIIELYEQEDSKLFDLSQEPWKDNPRKILKKEFQECSEKCDILTQMLYEIPMDNIENDVTTGEIKQIFIGTISDRPDIYFDCKDSKERYYYINMKIMGCDDGLYTDQRLLRLSHKIWVEWWLFNFKYEEEKEQRIKKNLCTYVQVTVIGGEVRKLKWYKRYNNKS